MFTNGAASPTSAIPKWLILLGELTAVAPLSIDMYLPSFPVVMADLAAPAGTVEYTLSTFFIGLTLGQLFYGPLSDRFGRKPPLRFGFALYALASIGCAFAQNVEMLGLCRFLQGLGGCAGIVIPNAIIRDRTNARDAARAFSMLMMVMGLAPILAPLIGGQLLAFWGWRSIFFVLALFGGLSFVAIDRFLMESHDTSNEPPLRLSTAIRNYMILMSNRGFMGYVLAGGLTTAGMFAYIAGSPFILMKMYAISPQQYGLFFGVNALGLIASSQINVRVLAKMPATQILRRALWVPPFVGLSLLFACFSGAESLTWFALAFFLFVSSIGWITPNAIGSALATHGQMAGTAAAFASAFQYLLATLAGAAVGFLHDGTGRPLALVMASCGIGAWLFHRILVQKPLLK
jgi:MFS transporter, DHA1 family, multidrug resistance protein